MINTIAGADSSAIIYSIAETAKANNLKPYDYFEYLPTEIPKHPDEKDTALCEDLLPWSDKLPDKLPDNCSKICRSCRPRGRLIFRMHPLWSVYVITNNSGLDSSKYLVGSGSVKII